MASGKGVVIKELSERGYKIFSLSDILRETLGLLQLPPDRVALQDVADLLRKHAGNGVLAERAVARINQCPDREIGIDSIRNPAEMHVLIDLLGAQFIGVDASFERSFANMCKRNREGDPKTWEEFVPIAERDRGIGQALNGQQVGACLKLAEPHVIYNDGSLLDLRRKIEAEFLRMGIEGKRPIAERK